MVAGRHIRFTAVLVAVVFALTGFSSHGGSSSSGSSGKSKSKSSGGGGCSSSKTKKKSHSSGNGSSSSPTPSPGNTAPPARAEVVSCVGAGKTEATLKVTSAVNTQRAVDVPVVFEGATGAAVDRNTIRLTLGANETRIVTVPMTQADKASEVKNCRLGRITPS
ncbi:hypothetical protein OG429_17375 [Streptomyces sp. NBC_00190]|uniref:hypothetical protein n=1 Tax=unclassified Streptomyces TaxID=2593676 RepID=UPI002E291B59|nr:hypothetical protein [Streptomyces sp. NBC_00190]WSZ40886.1 hypothetical protein OG239_20075 [Streptomyces sp. NBC_00868]